MIASPRQLNALALVHRGPRIGPTVRSRSADMSCAGRKWFPSEQMMNRTWPIREGFCPEPSASSGDGDGLDDQLVVTAGTDTSPQSGVVQSARPRSARPSASGVKPSQPPKLRLVTRPGATARAPASRMTPVSTARRTWIGRTFIATPWRTRLALTMRTVRAPAFAAR